MEFDQRTAIVNLMLQVARDAGLQTPCLRKYSDHTQAWRQAVAEYHGIEIADAKAALMKATFGFALPVGDAAAGTLPFLQGRCIRHGIEVRDLVTHMVRNKKCHDTTP